MLGFGTTPTAHRRWRPIGAWVAVALCTLGAALISAALRPAPARAAADQVDTFEAPNELVGGSPATRAATLDELKSLGVSALRMTVFWDHVAPAPDARLRPHFAATDPASYNWAGYGALADEAHARGLKLFVDLSGPVPRWATVTGRDHVSNPIPAEYRSFTLAAGRRFGADATFFSIWNEPNLSKFLAPQTDAAGRLFAPLLYRSLFFAGYHGLRAAGVQTPVLAGELEPVGNVLALAPLRFLRGALCLDSRYHPSGRCSRLPAAGFSIHPYMRPVFPTTRPPGFDDVTIGGLDRLVRALDRAARAGRVAPRLPIYATEFGVQSYPNRLAGVPLNRQSDYRSLAEFLAWGNSRVASFSQYLLNDAAPTAGPALSRYVFQFGLYLYAGHQRKPVYDSFRTPLVVRRHGATVELWGLVRPARAARSPGTIDVQTNDLGHGWRHLLTAAFGRSGYWDKHSAWRRGRVWRVRWTAPSGSTFTGPATAAYSF